MGALVVDTPLKYTAGQEPTVNATFRDSAGNVIDFSSGWTFTAKVGDSTGTKVTQSSGIVGSSVSPNVSIPFAASALDIAPGNYVLQVRAVNIASGRDRYFQTNIQIGSALA